MDIEKRMRAELGRRIVQLRESRGLSQVNLAKQLHVDRSRLSKWECGQHQPHMHHLLALADALGVPVDALLRGDLPEAPMAANVRDTLAGMVSTLNRLLQSKSERRRGGGSRDQGDQQ